MRRNRSVVSDLLMGQVLNMVTCPKCGFTSRNFDPFSMLSVPIPSISEVAFRVTVMRKGGRANESSILGYTDEEDGDGNEGVVGNRKRTNTFAGPPSTELVMEHYAIPMPTLSDMGDLKLQIQNLTGIRKKQLQLVEIDICGVAKNLSDYPSCSQFINIQELGDKEGTSDVFERLKKEDKATNNVCVRSEENVASGATGFLSHIIAFEHSTNIVSVNVDETKLMSMEGLEDDGEGGGEGEDDRNR